MIAHFGPQHFDSLTVWDHSPLATEFAANAAQAMFPTLAIAQATPGFLCAFASLRWIVGFRLKRIPAQHIARNYTLKKEKN